MSNVSPLLKPLVRPLTRAITEAGVGAWSPLNEPTLRSWYVIGDLSTLSQTAAGAAGNVAVGNPVGRIEDKSGNARHITFLDAARMTLRQDALGYYYLEGDGTAKYGSVAASAALFKFLHDGTGGTMGVAAAIDDTPADNTTMRIFGTGFTTTLAGAGFDFVTGAPGASTAFARWRIGNGSASVINTNTDLGDVRTDGIAQTIISTYKTQSGADARFYLDGWQPIPSGVVESNTPSSGNSADNLQLSSNNAGTYFNGKFYGAADFASELSQATRQQFARYLRGLYGDTSYLLAVGDSHTYNNVYGQNRQNFYPARLDVLLRPGLRWSPLNYGVSGNSTANIIARLSTVVEAGYGDAAIIYAGTNDVGNASTVQAAPAPTTTSFAVAAGKGVYYGVGGQIRVNGVAAIVQSVSTDTITLTAPLAFTPTAGQAVSLDVEANLVTIGNYLKAAGYSRIIVCGQHYLNFASGTGDTVAVPNATNAALRVLQSAAATTLGALYVDLHAYMRALIVAGTYVQGDDTAWHVAVGNTHLNNVGEQIVADAIYAAMQAQGWT